MKTKELPKYKSHKVVSALQIKEIIRKTDGTAVLKFVEKGYDDIVVNTHYMRKFQPKSGGYYVVYSDKYTSFSPKEAFENGYKELENVITEEELDEKFNSLNVREEDLNKKEELLNDCEKDVSEKEDLISQQYSEIANKEKELEDLEKSLKETSKDKKEVKKQPEKTEGNTEK